MGQKLVIGPINKGLRKDVEAFNIDNDSFPTLINAYQWRGRLKRKRGTAQYGRLTRNLYSQSFGLTSGAGSISGDIITLLSLGSTASIKPGTVSIVIGAATLTDNSNGDLSGGGASGNINYASGVYSVTGAPANTATFISFAYYPGLPVLGIEPFVEESTAVPEQIGFDTTYAYALPISPVPTIYSVSFYNNPTVPGKATPTPVNWNLANYQQMWTTNYQGAMWAVPGIRSPFDADKVGMQFKPITSVTNTTGGATARLNITAHGLTFGDYVFVNEVATTTGINFETGYVSSVDPQNANFVDVTFPTATITTNGTGGIAQYLTRSSDSTKDCIRWYNGSPIDDPTIPSFNPDQGWVNFCPPLTTGTVGTFSISDLPSAQYYLVGARMAVPFKDRLIFFGPIVQDSTNPPIYLQDTIIYSQNGTPYYTCSFPYSTNVPSPSIIPTTTFTRQILPTNQTAQPSSWWENATGFGGFLSAGYSRPMTTVSINEDALIVGFSDRQTRLLYSGNDIVPFNFYVINSELGSDATFSSITLDRGVITVGGRGIVLTSQTSTQRIDIEIPDKVFEFTTTSTSIKAVCAQRDFINEWIHFTFDVNTSHWEFPTQTLQYNYREGTWALFNESYTTYGTVRLISSSGTNMIWSNVVNFYPTWARWTDPWNAGQSTVGQPVIMAGNAQGYIVLKGFGTGEAPSLFVKNITVGAKNTTITSPNHCLNNGDFITFSDILGTLGTSLNQSVFQVSLVTDMNGVYNPDTFTIASTDTGTYLGSGQITRMYRPYIQSKQFPVSWDMGRKTRIGAQQYLLSKTNNAQITLLIFLSQNSVDAYNNLEFPDPVEIVPSQESLNDSLIYSTILYTCPESTNLGLTPFNKNLQMVTGSDQQQIWHRMNTSLLGDTVQVGFTMNNAQMLASLVALTASITGATKSFQCVLTCTSSFVVGDIVQITSVSGMVELNNNTYSVLEVTPTTVTISADSRAFSTYTSGGTATTIPQRNQFSEIEIHSAILDLQPSSLLA